jgi:hypothetical protein
MQSQSDRNSVISVCTALVFAVTLFAATAPAQNLVVNGDFENGNRGFTTAYTLGDVSGPGTYNVGPNPSSAAGAYGDWCNCGDHTTGSGMMMIVNGANSSSWSIWEETVQVSPSTEYRFSYWGAEVDHVSSSLPRLALKINGRVIGSSYFPQNSPDNNGQWKNFTFTWNSGSSHSADLVLVDLNTDASWNDFAIDDISFSPVADAGGAPASGGTVSANGPITSHAQVTVKDANGVSIALKPEEKIALMFVNAIESMEDDCFRHLQRRCSLAELVAGVPSPDWKIGRLKYDPATDSNYTYIVSVNATREWTASATPQHPGLGGFFVDGRKGIISSTYFKPNGAATTKDVALSEIGIGGELFQVR